MEELLIVTTGGTIDKIYFDDKSDYQVGDPQIGGILRELGVAFRFTVIPIIRKDSLHINQEDRELLRATIAAQSAKHVLITHGTDSMVETAKVLASIQDKTIVLLHRVTIDADKIRRFLDIAERFEPIFAHFQGVDRADFKQALADQFGHFAQ